MAEKRVWEMTQEEFRAAEARIAAKQAEFLGKYGDKPVTYREWTKSLMPGLANSMVKSTKSVIDLLLKPIRARLDALEAGKSAATVGFGEF